MPITEAKSLSACQNSNKKPLLVTSEVELMATLPPPWAPPDALARLRNSLREAGAKIAVIDDDPTGTQVVADVPVITSWQDPEIDWALSDPSDMFFVSTNTRSAQPLQAAAVNRELGERIARRSAAANLTVRCCSRGDSTLRGHFPLETDALIEGLRAGGQRVDRVLLCPAFVSAGRVTIGDVHYVKEGTELVPVAETEFARDRTFGYTSSNLVDWAVERGVDRERIASVDLAELRTAGEDYAASFIQTSAHDVLIANAAAMEDLELLALGVDRVERSGTALVYRTGPSLVAVLGGQSTPPPLPPDEVKPLEGPGLIVVGSHTALTTRQLDRARERHGFPVIELRIDSSRDMPEEVEYCARKLRAALREGTAALMTSRSLLAGATPEESLAIAGRVARALVEVVADIPESQPLGWVIAKGGITSIDIASKALRSSRARALGQILPGLIAVWRLDATSNRADLPYVVFPGNVGGDDALCVAIDRMQAQ